MYNSRARRHYDRALIRKLRMRSPQRSRNRSPGRLLRAATSMVCWLEVKKNEAGEMD